MDCLDLGDAMTDRTRSALALAAALAIGGAASHAATYPSMAPVADYLMADRAAEVALARSAAPPAISDAATVMVLEKDGYKTATKGTNGFVCLVERAWMSAFDAPGFWNPKTRGPVCYNPAAARSILPITLKRTALALGERSKPAMLAALRSPAAQRALPRLEPGAMSYMMSRRQALGEASAAWKPHLMFYAPMAGAAAWGANAPNSPVILDDRHTQIPESVAIFLVPVGTWSDGAPAGTHGSHGRAHQH